jgi:hypothetical protein
MYPSTVKVGCDKGSDPVAHGLGRDPEEERDALHGDATQRQKHCLDLHRERLSAWGRAGTLIATRPTKPLGRAGHEAVVDGPITLARGPDLHRYPSSQRWAYLSRGGSITRRKTWTSLRG